MVLNNMPEKYKGIIEEIRRENKTVEAQKTSEVKRSPHHAIVEIEGPIKRLIEQIQPSIEKGDYAVIIGDDASGRIPTLIFSRFIRKIYEQKGYNSPEVRFIAGSRNFGTWDEEGEGGKYSSVRSFLKNLNIASDKKVLIVTDTIASGSSLLPIVNALRSLGAHFDIVTVGMLLGYEDEVKKKLGDNIYIGVDHLPGIYSNDNLSGVFKKKTELHSKTLKSQLGRSFDRSDDEGDIQENIKNAREDANEVADHLIDWYESQENEK